MRKPFWLINGKLCEADFFLDKLRTANDIDDARYYFSAFVSAARSITYALQVCLKGFRDFDQWYDDQRRVLRDDPVARYFHNLRNQVIHECLNPLGRMTRTMYGTDYYLEGDAVPERDAITACRAYMSLLVRISCEAFRRFWSSLDLPETLTVAELEAQGRTIEDIEEEFDMPRGWSGGEGVTSQMRIDRMKWFSSTDIRRLSQRYPPQNG